MKTLLFSNQMHGTKALWSEGVVWHVDEFYFDNPSWKVRYLVLDVGN